MHEREPVKRRRRAHVGTHLAAATVGAEPRQVRLQAQNYRKAVANAVYTARTNAISLGLPVAVRIGTAGDEFVAFEWLDDGDRALDVSDSNGNGRIDGGDGEVGRVLARVDLERASDAGGSPVAATRLVTSGSFVTTGAGCNGGTVQYSLDAQFGVFLPNGLLVGADFLPCTYRMYLHTAAADLWSVIDILPAGTVEAHDAF